ncbi:MAG: helix-turn-helix domain-containing protein [Solirubrobacteraceae bacterium]
MTSTTGDIRERRMAAGLSRQKLAQYADCSISYVQMIEAGLRPSRSDVLPRLEAALSEIEHEPERTAT